MNLDTYKIHSLGDYVEAIRQYGTTDSYSTELVKCLSYLEDAELHISNRENWSTIHPRQYILEPVEKDF